MSLYPNLTLAGKYGFFSIPMGDTLVSESDLEGEEIRRKNPEERFSGAPIITAGRMYVRTKERPD